MVYAILFVSVILISMVMLLGTFPNLASDSSDSNKLRFFRSLQRDFFHPKIDKFDLEAKLYLSTTESVESTDSFFASARPIWNITADKTDGSYRSRGWEEAAVPLSDEFKSNGTLYGHMFIQSPGQFSPHPNMSDPNLVHTRYPLLGLTLSDRIHGDVFNSTRFQGPLEAFYKIPLVDKGKAPYPSKEMQSKFTELENCALSNKTDFVLGELVDKRRHQFFYQEHLQLMVYIESLQLNPFGYLDKLRDGDAVAMGFSLDINIKSLYIKDPMDPEIMQVRSYNQTLDLQKRQWSEPDYEPVVKVALACVSLFPILGLACFLVNMEFWFGTSKTDVGISRSMVFIYRISLLLNLGLACYTSETWQVLPSVIYPVAESYMAFKKVGISFNPRKAYQQILGDYKQVVDVESSNPEDEGNYDPSDDLTQETDLIVARVDTDKSVMKWVKLGIIPWLLVTTVLTFWIYAHDGMSFGRLVVQSLSMCLSGLISLGWMPQILVNKKSETAYSTPILLHILGSLLIIPGIGGGLVAREPWYLGVPAVLLPALIHIALVAQRVQYKSTKHK